MMMMMMLMNAYQLFGQQIERLSESQHWPTGKSDESPLRQEEMSSARLPPAM